MKKAKALRKDLLVKTANDILEKKYPSLTIDLADFEITAWSNKKKTLVNFKRLIQFTPQGNEESNYDYDLSINIDTKEVSPIDSWGIESFYIPTEEELQKIQFVKEAFGLPISGFDNKVVEEADMYIIYVDNEVSYGRYYIDKITGEEVLGSIQSSYLPSPNPDNTVDKDPLIEIKE